MGSTRRRGTGIPVSRVLIAALVGASIPVIYGLVLREGGTSSVVVNFYYLPIVVAAFYFGDLGGMFVAVLCALCAGPWVDKDIAHAVLQPPADILVRTAFFYGVAVLVSRLSAQLQKQAAQSSALLIISQAISSSLRLEVVLHTVAQRAVQLLEMRGCSIRLVDDSGTELVPAMTYGLSDAYRTKGPVKIDASEVDRQVLAGEMVAIRDVRTDNRFQYQQEAAEEGLVSSLSAPLPGKSGALGVIRVYSDYPRRFSPREEELLATFAAQAAMAIENARLYERIEQNYFETVRALSRAIEAKDPVTLGHSERVTEIAVRMADQLSLPTEQRQIIRFGGILHDIGKIGLGEGAMMSSVGVAAGHDVLLRLHPLIGNSILEPVEFLRPALEMVRYHHERFDGQGYPEGLAGEEIPLLARLLSVANVYDHLTAGAEGAPAFAPEDALGELRRQAGTRFDPAMVEVLAAVIKRLPVRSLS